MASTDPPSAEYSGRIDSGMETEEMQANCPIRNEQNSSEPMRPGPIDPSLLHLQNRHRSAKVYNADDSEVLRVRRRESTLRREQLDSRVLACVSEAGFEGVARMEFIQLDWALITALVDRWRPETHTFHMPCGEITVTLYDVQIILGLPTAGRALIGPTMNARTDLCVHLLGTAPSDVNSGRIPLRWLAQTFGEVPDDADSNTVLRHARAYIMQLIGGVLFTDTTGDRVHLMYLTMLGNLNECAGYSWGAACLAYLYRQLCRCALGETCDIGGCMILLQIWAWEHFPHIAPVRRQQLPVVHGIPLASRWIDYFDVRRLPTHVIDSYRLMFDLQTNEQIIWDPYSETIRETLPEYCFSGKSTWRAQVHLICFCFIEPYNPDRVMRQFGGFQRIPSTPQEYSQHTHDIDLRGKWKIDWVKHFSQYVAQWEDRHLHVVPLENPGESMVSDDYIPWFRRLSRLHISRHGVYHDYVIQVLRNIQMMSKENNMEIFNYAREAEDAIRRAREFQFKVPPEERAPSPPPQRPRQRRRQSAHEDSQEAPYPLDVAPLNVRHPANEAGSPDMAEQDGGDAASTQGLGDITQVNASATPCAATHH